MRSGAARARGPRRAPGRPTAPRSRRVSAVLLLHVSLERVELIAPEGLHLVQPGAHARERLGPEPVLAAARVVLDRGLLHEPRLAQDAQVTAGRRARHL